jgi:hypothetical protein
MLDSKTGANSENELPEMQILNSNRDQVGQQHEEDNTKNP